MQRADSRIYTRYMLRPGARLVVVVLAAASVGLAQDIISAKAGLVYFVQGRVSIVGSGRLASGAINRQLNEGETLIAEHGRAEVLLNPGTVLRVGDNTRIRMDGVQLTDTRVSVEAGSVVVTVEQPPKLDRVEIHAGGSIIEPKSSGIYRINAEPACLRVYNGEADVFRDDDPWKTVAKRGQAVSLDDLQLTKFDADDADSLQVWAEKRGPAPLARPRTPILLSSLFGGGDAKTPSDLIRFVNEHVKFEWKRMGGVTGAAADLLETCAEPRQDCSAKLIDVPELLQQIVILRTGLPPPVFLLYREKDLSGKSWEFAGAYGGGRDMEPDYRVIRRGPKTYLAITRTGLTAAGVDVEAQDWLDLTAPRFEPALSLFTSLKFSDRREYETTASIVSWENDPIETVRVEYRASAGQNDEILGTQTAAATFVRQGDRFVFDRSRSTVPEKARWGEFDVDGVRLLSH